MGGIPDSEFLIPEMLKKEGYTTKLIGKWHLGHREQYLPLKHGFDEWFGAPNCHFTYNDHNATLKSQPGPNIPVYYNDKMIGRYYDDIIINQKTWESNYTRYLLDEAMDYIRKPRKSPFFLYWAPDSTHAPNYASRKYLNTSRRNSHYGDSLKEIDDAIGIIMEGIKNHENTLVIFTSDNGAALVSKDQGGSNGPLLCGKQTTFEGGFRTPTIFWWPEKIPPNSVSHRVGTQMDFMATFADILGVSLPKDRIYDSYSLTGSLFDSNAPNVQIPVFYYRGYLLMAIRYGDYKMHLWTWTTPISEIENGIDHCPDMNIPNVTTTTHVDHRKFPILFNINRDPGERYPIKSNHPEYKIAIKVLNDQVSKHNSNLTPGKPQLNWCDNAVMVMIK